MLSSRNFGLKTLKYFPLPRLVHNSASQVQNNKPEKLKLSFQDPESIYKGKKTWELGRAWLVFSLCGVRTLIENNQKMMKVSQKMLGDKFFGKLMKMTFFGQFVGGEKEEDLKLSSRRWRTLG